MNRPAGGGGPGRWATIAIALAVVAMLAGAAWLFATDDGDRADDDRAVPPAERAEGVLALPDPDEVTDSRRRGDAGRTRIDEDEDDTEDGDAPDEHSLERRPLSPAFEQLRGMRITLVPASAATLNAEDEDGPVRVGTVRTTCAGAPDADRAARERAIIERVEVVLKRAGAEVVRLEDARGELPCVNTRIRLVERGDLGVVVMAGAPRAASSPAVRAGTLPPREARRALGLARELSATLDVPLRPAERPLLVRAGALDLPGGASSVAVQLPHQELDEAQLDRVALALATGIATAAGKFR